MRLQTDGQGGSSLPPTLYVEWDLNIYCTVLFIATLLYVASLYDHAIVTSGMYYIVFY